MHGMSGERIHRSWFGVFGGRLGLRGWCCCMGGRAMQMMQVWKVKKRKEGSGFEADELMAKLIGRCGGLSVKF